MQQHGDDWYEGCSYDAKTGLYTIKGALGDEHTVILDARRNWPRVTLTCSCGWEDSVYGEDDLAPRDAVSKAMIHVGGVIQDGGHILDVNTVRARLGT